MRYLIAPDFPAKASSLTGPQIIYNADGVDETVFYRLDRGAEEVDHHSFFFYQGTRLRISVVARQDPDVLPGPKYHVHHSSYETHDFDTQVLGHDWLRERGYKNCWGVGRHVLGSQIFDYWYIQRRGPFASATGGPRALISIV